ncbi:hypothetical protein PIB30_071283, partial [Stylosanthes scabra]|nr:hypothetical protein [Stylosanthes scabra]
MRTCCALDTSLLGSDSPFWNIPADPRLSTVCYYVKITHNSSSFCYFSDRNGFLARNHEVTEEEEVKQSK